MPHQIDQADAIAEVPDVKTALAGTRYIVAERLAKNAELEVAPSGAEPSSALSGKRRHRAIYGKDTLTEDTFAARPNR